MDMASPNRRTGRNAYKSKCGSCVAVLGTKRTHKAFQVMNSKHDSQQRDNVHPENNALGQATQACVRKQRSETTPNLRLAPKHLPEHTSKRALYLDNHTFTALDVHGSKNDSGNPKLILVLQTCGLHSKSLRFIPWASAEKQQRHCVRYLGNDCTARAQMRNGNTLHQLLGWTR